MYQLVNVSSLNLSFATDLKSSNLFIPLEGQYTSELSEYLHTHPALAYDPHVDLQISPEPIITFRSQTLPRIGPTSFDQWHVCLGDYGEGEDIVLRLWTSSPTATAVPVEKTHELTSKGQDVMPVSMRAPEVTLHAPWGQPIDIWALGALVSPIFVCCLYEANLVADIYQAFELVTGDMGHIFDVSPVSGMNIDEIRLARIEELCGPFPKSSVLNAPRGKSFFDSEGKRRIGDA